MSNPNPPQPYEYDPNYRPPAYPQQPRPQPQGVVTAKSPGIAVLLEIFLPGAGLIYAGSVVVGLLILFIVTPLMWVSVVFTVGIGLLWYIPYLIIMMVASYSVASGYNRRNGITVR